MAVTGKLKHADGTAVTAQEAYDAFMNTRVLINESGIAHEVINMVWYDNNSEQTNSANVGYVELEYVEAFSATATTIQVLVGDSSLKPA